MLTIFFTYLLFILYDTTYSALSSQRREREMLQLLEKEEENTCEIASTFTSLQHEVEAKTHKLKKMFSRLQSVKQEIIDLQDEFSKDRTDMQQTQEDLTKLVATFASISILISF